MRDAGHSRARAIGHALLVVLWWVMVSAGSLLLLFGLLIVAEEANDPFFGDAAVALGLVIMAVGGIFVVGGVFLNRRLARRSRSVR